MKFLDKWSQERPTYSLLPIGVDCQEYDKTVNSQCRSQCNNSLTSGAGSTSKVSENINNTVNPYKFSNKLSELEFVPDKNPESLWGNDIHPNTGTTLNDRYSY